jgi:hypothetical protein
MVATMAVGVEGSATTVRRAETNTWAVVQQDGRHQAEKKEPRFSGALFFS